MIPLLHPHFSTPSTSNVWHSRGPRLITSKLVETSPRTAVSFALTCWSLEEPTFSSLWKVQRFLTDLVKALPDHNWNTAFNARLRQACIPRTHPCRFDANRFESVFLGFNLAFGRCKGKVGHLTLIVVSHLEQSPTYSPRVPSVVEFWPTCDKGAATSLSRNTCLSQVCRNSPGISFSTVNAQSGLQNHRPYTGKLKSRLPSMSTLKNLVDNYDIMHPKTC